jgi:hypothetical protein
MLNRVSGGILQDAGGRGLYSLVCDLVCGAPAREEEDLPARGSDPTTVRYEIQFTKFAFFWFEVLFFLWRGSVQKSSNPIACTLADHVFTGIL